MLGLAVIVMGGRTQPRKLELCERVWSRSRLLLHAAFSITSDFLEECVVDEDQHGPNTRMTRTIREMLSLV